MNGNLKYYHLLILLRHSGRLVGNIRKGGVCSETKVKDYPLGYIQHTYKDAFEDKNVYEVVRMLNAIGSLYITYRCLADSLDNDVIRYTRDNIEFKTLSGKWVAASQVMRDENQVGLKVNTDEECFSELMILNSMINNTKAWVEFFANKEKKYKPMSFEIIQQKLIGREEPEGRIKECVVEDLTGAIKVNGFNKNNCQIEYFPLNHTQLKKGDTEVKIDIIKKGFFSRMLNTPRKKVGFGTGMTAGVAVTSGVLFASGLIAPLAASTMILKAMTSASAVIAGATAGTAGIALIVGLAIIGSVGTALIAKGIYDHYKENKKHERHPTELFNCS